MSLGRGGAAATYPADYLFMLGQVSLAVLARVDLGAVEIRVV